ncbi:hypothetical protein [Kitasatospora sp. NPDC001175]|uniref:hypothetical protein n=1 Tax=Kitasatospora sp. NPDC001175 TaxID=3157103 RepID=UPI003D06B4AA
MALAVAVDPADFARLREHGLFGGVDYGYYLRRTENQLRALRGEGLEVHLRVLEPLDFADFCEQHLLAQDDPVARVAYAADPELAGEPFVYRGEPLAELLPVLLADHLARVRISVGTSVLLMSVGLEEQPEERLSAVLQYVSEVYLALGAGAGEGRQLLVLRSVGLLDGEQLSARAEPVVESGAFTTSGREVEAFCITLAAAVAGHGAGELLLYRPARADGGREALGWVLVDGWLRPMSVVETAAALVAVGAEGPPGRLAARAGFPLPSQWGRWAGGPPQRPADDGDAIGERGVLGEAGVPDAAGPGGGAGESGWATREQGGDAAGGGGEAGR